MEYQIDYRTQNVPEAAERLRRVLKTLCEAAKEDPNFAHVNEEALHRIVVAESNKTYLTKHVDEDNKEGLFRGYKDVCKQVAAIVYEINPDYAYPHALVSTVLEASHQQPFFAKHLPSLTEIKNTKTLHTRRISTWKPWYFPLSGRNRLSQPYKHFLEHC